MSMELAAGWGRINAPKVTVDTYGHLIPGANKAAVDRLDDATGPNPGATSGEPVSPAVNRRAV
jgi:hypothetical protein